MLARHSLNVGIGKDAGRDSAGLDMGSWKIACDIEWCEECLYLCPLRAEILDLITGLFAIDIGWKLNGPEALLSAASEGVK